MLRLFKLAHTQNHGYIYMHAYIHEQLLNPTGKEVHNEQATTTYPHIVILLYIRLHVEYSTGKQKDKTQIADGYTIAYS